MEVSETGVAGKFKVSLSQLSHMAADCCHSRSQVSRVAHLLAACFQNTQSTKMLQARQKK